MAYWWVNQNRTWVHERDGRYLWAPHEDKRGARLAHWETMDAVRPGDLIFHYVDQHIVALSRALTRAYDEPNPGGADFADWNAHGRMIRVGLAMLPRELHRDRVPGAMKLVEAPFQRDGNVKVGYLWSVTSRLGDWLLAELDVEGPPQRLSEDEARSLPIPRGTGTRERRASSPTKRVAPERSRVCTVCFIERPLHDLDDGVCEGCRSEM